MPKEEESIEYYQELLKKHGFPVEIKPCFPDSEDERVEIEWQWPRGPSRAIYANTKKEAEMVLRGMFAVVQYRKFDF